jgi:hypothetical protein
MVGLVVSQKPFLALTDLRVFLFEWFPLAFDMFHPLQLEIVARGRWKSIEGDGETAIEDDEETAIDAGDAIDVAARVEQLTGRSRLPEPEVLRRGLARIPDEGTVGHSDRHLSAMKTIRCRL